MTTEGIAGLLGFGVGVASSVLASIIFVLFFSRIRPRIDISEKICRSKADEGDGEDFEIKIINRSRVPCVNLRAELQLVKQIIVPSGYVQIWEDVELVRPNPMQIEKYDRKDQYGLYAFYFRARQNLEELWADDTTSFLRLRVFATHSLSGFSKVFVRNYFKKSVLARGEFVSGDSFEIR